MEFITGALSFLQTPAFAGIVTGLLVVSEALASIPAIQANSIFQAIRNGLESFAKKG